MIKIFFSFPPYRIFFSHIIHDNKIVSSRSIRSSRFFTVFATPSSSFIPQNVLFLHLRLDEYEEKYYREKRKGKILDVCTFRSTGCEKASLVRKKREGFRLKGKGREVNRGGMSVKQEYTFEEGSRMEKDVHVRRISENV